MTNFQEHAQYFQNELCRLQTKYAQALDVIRGQSEKITEQEHTIMELEQFTSDLHDHVEDLNAEIATLNCRLSRSGY